MICEKLKVYIETDPTKESQLRSIKEMCEEIDNKKLILPIFQTHLRWTSKQVVELFNYQLQGKAPVAPISINKITKLNTKFADHVSFLSRDSITNELLLDKYSVTDGQQRLSTNYKAYINHPDFFNIVLDLKAGRFKTIKVNSSPKSYHVPVGILYNKDFMVLDEYAEKNKFLNKRSTFNLLNLIRNKFLGYRYTINYAQNMNEKEQMEWFDVLNLAGSTVTAVMVNLSELLSKGIDFYKNFSDPFLQILSDYDYLHLLQQKSTEVSIPLAALNANLEIIMNRQKTTNFSPIPSDVKPEILASLNKNQIEEIFTKSLDNLETACLFFQSIDFLPTRIDYITYALTVFSHIPSPTEKQLIALTHWIKTINFKNKSNSVRRSMYSQLIKKITEI